MATKKNQRADYIEHGSDKHKALLGINRQDDEKEKAKLQAALDAGKPPTIQEMHDADERGLPMKKPVNRGTYRQGQVITDGWVRQGR